MKIKRKTRTPPLTGAMIARALSAAEAAGTDDDTLSTLNELYAILTSGTTNDTEAVRITPGLGLPLTVAQVDAALAEAGVVREIPRGHREVLKRARDMLAQAETEQTALASIPITRGEFDSFCNAVALAISNIDSARQYPGRADVGLERLGTVLANARDYNLSQADHEGLKRLVARLDAVAERDGVARRKRGGRTGRPFY